MNDDGPDKTELCKLDVSHLCASMSSNDCIANYNRNTPSLSHKRLSAENMAKITMASTNRRDRETGKSGLLPPVQPTGNAQ